MIKLSLTTICFMILLISFLGFVTENIWLALTKGWIDNRNMRLPFLLGYGLLVIFIYLLIGLPQNRISYFFQSAVIVMTGEILLGVSVEKICHFEWWNYSWLPLHITKYTSIPTTVLFALLITAFMDQLFLPIAAFFQNLSSDNTCFPALGMLILLFADMLHSFYKMYREKGLYLVWRVSIGSHIGELSRMRSRTYQRIGH